MEEQLVQLLANTTSAQQAPRQQAEIDLKRARTNPDFPVSLAKVASHTSVDNSVRQAALLSLRSFISYNWGVGDQDDEPQIPISDEARAFLRQSLLDLSLSQEDDRKVKISASAAVGKIAIHDFPEQWPDLLPTILKLIPNADNAQLHGALRVLGDLVEESLSEDQFFSMARDIARILTDVALDQNRKPMLRALAISVFRSCFDLMNMVKDDHTEEVNAFAEELLVQWNPFFVEVIKSRLPEGDLSEGSQPESWNSVIALKLQAVKTLLRIRHVFPNLLLQHITTFFTAIWEELDALQVPHERLFIENNGQGRLEDSDSLPYTLDFLVLEDIDFLNQCFRSPPVKAELDGQLQSHGQQAPWMREIMKMLVAYSRVGQEDEDLWDIDCSLYLAEETSVSANYTARTAAGDLLVKLGEWFNEKAVKGLFEYTKTLFPGEGSSWRIQEAALYLFVMLLSDFQDLNKSIGDDVSNAYLELVDYTISKPEHGLLRARGYLAAGALGQSISTPPALVERMIHAINTEDVEVVQVSAIKALEGLINAGRVSADQQAAILSAIQTYMNGKDPADMEEADELVVLLAEALRAAINLDTKIALSNSAQSTDLLFLLAKLGSTNFQVTMLVSEALEQIVTDHADVASFSTLCASTLPTLTGAFDVATVTKDDPLVEVAAELLAVMAEHGSEPLPAGFVATVFPKLSRVLMQSEEGEVLRPGAEAVKWILRHDHQQLFDWHVQSGLSGLETCLHIIDRLLGPTIEDNSASEVGGLAAELVEKAGHERLGPFLPQLLQAVANRLATAQAAAFIQSLILVFARLSLNGAQDVVEFLSQIEINGESGLQVVMAKWLENSVSFAGYDEIRQNVIALTKLYSLNDPRLAQIQVKGDLIVAADDGKIKTRSRAKQNPDQYTAVPASLKIIKVLVEELLSASGAGAAATAAAAVNAPFAGDSDDDGWEDDDTIDLSLAKADLMSYMAAGPMRRPDDETQTYLTEFFVRCARENTANFQDWYGMLSQDEQSQLNEFANAAQ